MKQRLWFFIVFLCCSIVCTAQQVISSGGYVAEPEISMKWVLGGNLTYVSAFGSSLDNPITPLESSMSLKIYPNPVIDFLNVEITPSDTGQIIFELYNSTGMMIMVEKYSVQPVYQFDVSDMLPGAYLLKAFSPTNEMFFQTKTVIKK